MKSHKCKVLSLTRELESIIKVLKKSEERNEADLKKTHPSYRESARNLIHYSAVRKFDLRRIQKALGNLGFSRLARAESHIMLSLTHTNQLLKDQLGRSFTPNTSANTSTKNIEQIIESNIEHLLGYKSKKRRTRIMVTMPTTAANDYSLVFKMASAGMNCVRINCAHDKPSTWLKMIANIKKASKAQSRAIKIVMDLAGPKIRTGAISSGAKVRKISPKRDELGRVLYPAIIKLTPEITERSQSNEISTAKSFIRKLKLHDIILFRDTRGKKRTLKVIATDNDTATLSGGKTCYIQTGTKLFLAQKRKRTSAIVGDLPSIERSIPLRKGDIITIHKNRAPGEPATFDNNGELLRQAHISCQAHEVFSAVKLGDPVLFNDGKIEGRVVKIRSTLFDVRIIHAQILGSKLKSEKGMNFPKTDIKNKGLTLQDKKDLRFIAQHADVVNVSFINSKQDIEQLLDELRQIGALDHLGIMLKIETRNAFNNLTEILLTAMQSKFVGVMIARGDLAVETGWENIGWVQKEVLALSSAAHVPVVWATQVLENLAKKGLPLRSEITDVVASMKADGVMLNKGPYILQAIRLSDTIMTGMKKHQEKNEALLPKMEFFSS